MKKILALVLAMLLVLGMTSAFAASITIKRDGTYDPADGSNARTYKAYKILDADTTASGSNTQAAKDPTYQDGAISYKIANDSVWLSVVQGASQWLTVKQAAGSTDWIVTLKTGVADSAETAKAMAEYFKSNIPASATGIDLAFGTANNVDNGYYLIVPSDGATNLALVTADVEIFEKNTYFNTHKEGPQTDYYVGEVIPYTATVFVPADTKVDSVILLRDTMSSQLTFQEDVTAKIGTDPFTGFTTSYGTGAFTKEYDSDTFEIKIPVTSELLGKTITFSYSGYINETALSDEAYVNELFGELNGYKTKPDKVKDWTFDLEFKKDFAGSTDEDLTATFELRKGNTALKFKTVNGKLILAKDQSDATASSTLTIHNGETLKLYGLDADTYTLVELTTSTGYNLLDGVVTATIAAKKDYTAEEIAADNFKPEHTVTWSGLGQTDKTGLIEVVNNSGNTLPSTGGMGTTILYIAGSILVLGAVIFLVTKRRMKVED